MDDLLAWPKVRATLIALLVLCGLAAIQIYAPWVYVILSCIAEVALALLILHALVNCNGGDMGI